MSFQGEKGAYSEAAAFARFPKAKPLPCPTFAAAVRAVSSKKADYAIIPVENSIAGSVGQSYDILRTTRMHIVYEVHYHIAHCLIGRGSLKKKTTVYSHPQALAQCRKFIESNRLKPIPTYDTAGSVAMISGMGDDVACIASAYAAKEYGMPIIKKGITGKADNYTRFVVLSRIKPRGQKATKTSIIVSLQHKKGALHSVLGVFAESGINLARIESRPKKNTRWGYDFFIDLECDSKKAAPALKRIRKLCTSVKNLGSYGRPLVTS